MLADVKVLWPEYEGYNSIMAYYYAVEYDIFRCKKLNAPHDPDKQKQERIRQQLVALEAGLIKENA